MAPKVKGVIFDMDGLMFDTERIWDQFWSPCCRKMSLPDPPPEFYSNGRGLAGEHQLQYIAGYYGDKAEELLHAVWAYGGEQIKKGVPCKPGLKELLSYLEDLGMPRIVASSSPRTMVELNLQTTGTPAISMISCAATRSSSANPRRISFWKPPAALRWTSMTAWCWRTATTASAPATPAVPKP